VEVVQRRSGRSVRMLRPSLVPEKFASRDGKESAKCVINIDDDKPAFRVVFERDFPELALFERDSTCNSLTAA
jgi:hypothetical protein